MKSMSLREIAAACGGTYFGPEANLGIEVSGVAIDSRKIEEGYLFIPIKGARVDGHDFIPAVMEKALCTLSEKDFLQQFIASYNESFENLKNHLTKLNEQIRTDIVIFIQLLYKLRTIFHLEVHGCE